MFKKMYLYKLLSLVLVLTSQSFAETNYSMAQTLENAAAQQRETAAQLNNISEDLKKWSMQAQRAGQIMTYSTSPQTVVAGKKLIKYGKQLEIFASIIGNKSHSMSHEIEITCNSLNKVTAHKINCPADARLESAVVFNGAFGLYGKSAVDDIPSFIDHQTGKCKEPVSTECRSLVSNAPANCFKASSNQGKSCYSQFDAQLPSLTKNDDKKFADLTDVSDEAALLKSGLSSTDIKEFKDMMNDPKSLLNLAQINSKGEFKNGLGSFLTTAPKPLSPSINGSSGTPGMTIKKDEYSPVESEVRAPATASTEETMGTPEDDLFKMISRRYYLKQQQNLFFDQ
jgi:hypothetical protein